jgi:hypothetical protein
MAAAAQSATSKASDPSATGAGEWVITSSVVLVTFMSGAAQEP